MYNPSEDLFADQKETTAETTADLSKCKTLKSFKCVWCMFMFFQCGENVFTPFLLAWQPSAADDPDDTQLDSKLAFLSFYFCYVY